MLRQRKAFEHIPPDLGHEQRVLHVVVECVALAQTLQSYASYSFKALCEVAMGCSEEAPEILCKKRSEGVGCHRTHRDHGHERRPPLIRTIAVVVRFINYGCVSAPHFYSPSALMIAHEDRSGIMRHLLTHRSCCRSQSDADAMRSDERHLPSVVIAIAALAMGDIAIALSMVAGLG